MIFIIMGVSGSGKTTIGKALAEKIGCLFADADDYHPQANIDKMRSGIPLVDQDRIPWLEALNRLMQEWCQQQFSAVLACSALKKFYRTILLTNIANKMVQIIYLKGSIQLIKERISRRNDHFMPPGLLQSQFNVLEEPDENANCITISIANDPSSIVDLIYTKYFVCIK